LQSPCKLINIAIRNSTQSYLVTFRRTIFILLAAACSAASSHAAVLAQYGFLNVRASTDLDLNSSASDFTNGSGIAAGSSTYYTTSPSTALNPSLATAATDTQATEALALTSNDYYTFTLTPNAGQKANLTSLTFDFAPFGNGTNTASFAVYSSVDSFATRIGSVATSTNSSAFTSANISLLASQYQNLTLPITFRIYVFDSNNSGGKGDLLDNVILNGDLLAVPEPSTYAMMGLGAGLLGAAQRFRRKRR
jgi:hypothetical protein